MDRNQQYLANLLEKVPKWELSDPQHQDAFDKVKLSLLNAADVQSQLRTLYKVTNFSEFALGLMWIADKVEKDPSKLDSTPEEESFIFSLLKKGFGEVPAEMPATADAFGFDVPQSAPTDLAQVPEAPFEGVAAEAPPPDSLPSGGIAGGNEQGFAATLEKLLEAVQSGSEERTGLLDELTSLAEGIVAAEDTDGEYKTFCGYLIEFMKYVSTNQLFDDIRVMNLLSNIYDPFSQWVKVDPSARSGLLEQAIETLRDFKALFE